MLDLDHLCGVLRRLDESARRPRSECSRVAMRRLERLAGEISILSPSLRTQFERACRELHPVVVDLAESAERGEPDPLLTRDAATLAKRVVVALSHVTAGASSTRLSAGQLRVHYARGDLVGSLRRVTDAFTRLAEERGLAYEVSLPSTVFAEVDVAKVEVALATTLFHAIKATPPGGAVGVRVKGSDADPDLVVEVLDGGASIPASRSDGIYDRNRVTDRSVPADVDGRRFSLSLARDLLRLQGGNHEVRARVGGGRFELRLPRCAPTGARVSARLPPGGHWAEALSRRAAEELRTEADLGGRIPERARPAVWVVSNARSLHRAIVDAFDGIHPTGSATDLVAGIAMACHMRPHLVIVDAEGSGADLETLIANHWEGFGVPTIALVEVLSEGLVERCFAAGIEPMEKPILISELRARATRLVERRHRKVARERDEPERGRDKLLRLVSHELRTPVAAMRFHQNVLERDPVIAQSSAIERRLEGMARSTSRLLQLVDTVLEWFRVEGPGYRPECEDIDLADLVGRTVLGLEAHARARNVTLRYVDSWDTLPLRSERRVVELVVSNLVYRAIVVSGNATVDVRIERSEGGGCVCVHDAAPRMTGEQVAAAFAPLARAELHEHRGGGSGLGVYLVRRMTLALGGQLRWRDAGGDGNVFVVEFPSLR